MFWDVLTGFIIVGALFWTVLAVLVMRKAGAGAALSGAAGEYRSFIWFALTEWPIQKDLRLLRIHEITPEQ